MAIKGPALSAYPKRRPTSAMPSGPRRFRALAPSAWGCRAPARRDRAAGKSPGSAEHPQGRASSGRRPAFRGTRARRWQHWPPLPRCRCRRRTAASASEVNTQTASARAALPVARLHDRRHVVPRARHYVFATFALHHGESSSSVSPKPGNVTFAAGVEAYTSVTTSWRCDCDAVTSTQRLD
jgi:hypothetical protein